MRLIQPPPARRTTGEQPIRCGLFVPLHGRRGTPGPHAGIYLSRGTRADRNHNKVRRQAQVTRYCQRPFDFPAALPHHGADAPEEKGDGRSVGVPFRVLLKEIEMLKNTFVERGTFAGLSPSKRIIRGVFGGALIAYFIWQLPKYGMLVNTDFPVVPGKWIGMAILFYFFADVFNIGFNRRWGRWPH